MGVIYIAKNELVFLPVHGDPFCDVAESDNGAGYLIALPVPDRGTGVFYGYVGAIAAPEYFVGDSLSDPPLQRRLDRTRFPWVWRAVPLRVAQPLMFYPADQFQFAPSGDIGHRWVDERDGSLFVQAVVAFGH